MEKLKQKWSLTDLYESFDDPDFIEDFEKAESRAKAFQKKYKGHIPEIAGDPSKMRDCLIEFEELERSFYRLYSFPGLSFAADTRDKDAQSWQDRVMERVSLAENYTVFLNLDIQALPEKTIETLIKAPELKPYIHYFQRLLDYKPHTLSEEVEQVLNETAVTGRQAFVHLRELHLGAQEFEPVTPPDGKPIDTEAGLSALQFHPDADTRLAAYKSVRKVYAEHNQLYGYILQKISQDHKMDASRRKYGSTLEKQLLSDEVSMPVYRTVIDVTRDGFPLFQEYYRYKAKALGVDKIRMCDIYAPYEPIDLKKSYEEGIEIIYSAMSRVDDEYLEIVKGFIEGEYVDSGVRKGKRGGAFCWGIWDYHPYVLLSYTGEPSSLFTLAHELGHGIHGVLTNRAQRLLGSEPPMVLAEIASTFNELLLLDHLLETETDEKLKKSVITHQLEDALNLLFRQTTISRLEEDIHNKAAEGTFDHEWVNERWADWYNILSSDAVEVLPEHQYDWARIGHIYFKPFYCYNYCLSYMVSLACYLKYRDEGKSFVPKFKELLSYGGSKAPKDALAVVGIDPSDPEIMKGAIDYNRDMLEKLVAIE
ncbi:oligoendopeptidase F [bacterium]|nr:MAG: oligoendopeptidase F [bacterium]